MMKHDILNKDMLAAILTLVLGLMLVSLTGCNLDRAADRATYRAVAPEYLEYVRKDPALDQDQKDRRERTVILWAARIDETTYR